MIGSANHGKDASNPAKKAWPWREAMTPSISHPFFTNLNGSSKVMWFAVSCRYHLDMRNEPLLTCCCGIHVLTWPSPQNQRTARNRQTCASAYHITPISAGSSMAPIFEYSSSIKFPHHKSDLLVLDWVVYCTYRGRNNLPSRSMLLVAQSLKSGRSLAHDSMNIEFASVRISVIYVWKHLRITY